MGTTVFERRLPAPVAIERSLRIALYANPSAVRVPPRHTDTVLTVSDPVISLTTRTASSGPSNM
jgi:hypothetical protein